MTPRIGCRVLYVWFGSVVPVRRAREFETRKPELCTWNSFVGKLLRSSIDAGPGSRARRLSNLQSGFILDCSLLEQALHAQSKAHVTRDAQLAGHERHLAVQLAAQHVEIVLRSHRDSDAR